MLKGKSQKELLKLSKRIIQPLLPNYYKGQGGKVVVIGGCEDYTGAPFFSCQAASLIGSDLSHVICEKLASPVIKLYSPDLMVHPYLYELTNPEVSNYFSPSDIEKFTAMRLEDIISKDFKKFDDFIESKILPKVLQLINRGDIFVIGPGFGRDSLMFKSMIKIIEQIKVVNKPMILDADALFLVSLDPTIIQNYEKGILTPNLIEFERIGNKFNLKSILKETNFDKVLEVTSELSKILGGLTIIRKGDIELIVNGDDYLVNDMKGSNRRVGGQGDTLTGCLATFVIWSYHYNEGYWPKEAVSEEPELRNKDLLLLACFAASGVTRLASSKAYKNFGRALQTSVLQSYLGEAYSELFDNEDFVKL